MGRRGVVGGYFFAKRELGETPDNTRLRLFPTHPLWGRGVEDRYFWNLGSPVRVRSSSSGDVAQLVEHKSAQAGLGFRPFPASSVGRGEGRWYFLLRRPERASSAPLVPALPFAALVKDTATSVKHGSAVDGSNPSSVVTRSARLPLLALEA